MPQQWQFWTGNAINPVADAHRAQQEAWYAEEAALEARVPDVKVRAAEVGKQFGWAVLEVKRWHPSGVSIPKDSRLEWMGPHRSVFMVVFEVCPADHQVAGWRVARRLPNGFSLAGSLSGGWTCMVEESRLELLRRAAEDRKEKAELQARSFGGDFRRGGKQFQSDYWVVRPNGTLRDPDEMELAQRGGREVWRDRGKKFWHEIAPEELAISWRGGSDFRLQVPAAGLTPTQIETVRQIESQDLHVEAGFLGLVSKKVAVVAQQPNVIEQQPESFGPVEISKINLSGLFAGTAKVRR